METIVAQNAAALEHIAIGNQKPYYWKQYTSPNGRMMGVKIDGLHEQRTLSRLLIWRAKFKAYHKDYVGEFKDIILCYRFGTHLKTPTTIIEQLVGISVESYAVKAAFQSLQNNDIDKETLADFKKQFQDAVDKNNFIMNFNGEELFIYDEIQRTFTGDMWGNHIIPRSVYALRPEVQVITALTQSDGVGQSQSQQSKPTWFSEKLEDVVFYVSIMATYIKEYNYLLFKHPNKQETIEKAKAIYDFWNTVAASTPYELKRGGINASFPSGQMKNNLLLEMLEPAFSTVHKMSCKNRCSSNALLATLAILRYKQDRGNFPETLENLVEMGYLKQVPMDPYSDKPLVYKKTDNNFTLYSVGENFINDGGIVAYYSTGKAQVWGLVNKPGDAVFWPVAKEKPKSKK
jgi:hypothetical protein